jgi:arylsulfatase
MEDNLKYLDELGSPKYFNHYPWGWAWAGDTPFRRWKRETYRGGISDPFIIHWPKGIKARGEIRTQYAHAIDMVPTVLEALNIDPPVTIKGVTQSPIQGLSFAHTFDDAKAPTKHIVQYFEMMGHRSIYYDGWRAVCPWPGPSFKEAGKPFGTPIPAEMLTELDAHHWELYHVAEDFAENHDLAASNREKLIEMIAAWYVEAGKYNVLPVDGRGALRLMEERPQIAADRTRCTYYPGTPGIPPNTVVKVLNRSHSITADVEISRAGAEGILMVQGGNTGGYVFYVKNGKLHWSHNYGAKEIYHVESTVTIPKGRHQLRFEFEVTGKPDIMHGKGSPGLAQLYIDKKLVGQADIPVTMPVALVESAVCGRAIGSPVTPDYTPPFEFTGKLYSVTVDVSGELIKDTAAELKVAMARQ